MKKVAARIENRKIDREKSYHVAFAMVGGRAIACSTNSRTDGHAETRLLAELERACTDHRRDIDIDIVIVRVANTSTQSRVVLKNSRPCVACSEAIGRSRLPVRSVSWSTADGTIVTVGPQEFRDF